MIHYRQYRPAFFEGFENEEGEVANVEELLKLEFVHNFWLSPKFHRFSIGTGIETPSGWMVTLMAEYRQGYEWWGVAYLWPQHREELEPLPQWKGLYKDKD